GGDGTAMIDWVLRAYESDDQLPMPAFIVFGPFLDLDAQASFNERIAKLPNVEAIAFESAPEQLMAGAAGVVAMCGYNTCCEIISFDCKAVVIPRTRPRLEQFIRANRAQELGLINILLEEGDLDAGVMATALRHLPQQGLPSQVVLPGLLDGLDNVNRLVDRLFASGRPRRGLHVAATP
ncbi:MAG: hypothetical protein ACTSWM_02040, partial [Alphaproteobacteria bacterium]